jgi:transposase
LLRALLLQAIPGIRSDHQLVERIDSDLLFCWFFGLRSDDAVPDASTFAKSRGPVLELDGAAELLAGVINHVDGRRQMSRDHFSLDGTLIDAPPPPSGGVGFSDR